MQQQRHIEEERKARRARMIARARREAERAAELDYWADGRDDRLAQAIRFVANVDELLSWTRATT